MWVLAPWLLVLLLCLTFTQPPSIAAYYRYKLYTSTLTLLRRLVTYFRETIVPLIAHVLSYAQNVLLPWILRHCQSIQDKSILEILRYCKAIRDEFTPWILRLRQAIQDEFIPEILGHCRAIQDEFFPWVLRQFYSFPNNLSALYARSTRAVTQLGIAWKTLSRTARRMVTALLFSTAAYIQGLIARWEEL